MTRGSHASVCGCWDLKDEKYKVCWITHQNFDVFYFYKGLKLQIYLAKIKRLLELLLYITSATKSPCVAEGRMTPGGWSACMQKKTKLMSHMQH
jgi:hypothetical protein